MNLTLSAIYAKCSHKTSGCKLWNGSTTARGYPIAYDKTTYCLSPRSSGLVSLRPVVWSIGGAVPPGHRIVMTCNNRTCLAREHMQPMTRAAAARYAADAGAYQTIRHVTSRKANLTKRAKISREQATTIREAALAGACRQALADANNIRRNTVDQIARGVRWAPRKMVPNASVFHQAA